MSSGLNNSVLKTLIYADIFGYPLKSNEVHRYLIKKKATLAAVAKSLTELTKEKIIVKSRDYYCLKGREKSVYFREKRKYCSGIKILKALKFCRLLFMLPFVKLIGITGTLSMENADDGDDIDVFIITSKNFIWTTRFFSVIFLKLFGLYRNPGTSDIRNKFCLNMFIDEGNLELINGEKDLFSAHEIAQMKPLFQRNNIYREFISINSWIKSFLPNFSPLYQFMDNNHKKLKGGVSDVNFLEVFFKTIQLTYMKRKITKEVIKDGYLRFHPLDLRPKILDEYYKKIKMLNIAKIPS